MRDTTPVYRCLKRLFNITPASGPDLFIWRGRHQVGVGERGDVRGANSEIARGRGRQGWLGTRHLSEQIAEQQVGLAVALVVGVITLLVGVDARTLPEVLGPIADEDGIVEACREDACTGGGKAGGW